ncbi:MULTISPECIES: competence type IV pilus assembly protein ComGB [Pontibacillus]|uniref:Competence type IV pilus assembly protein ComGB n=1 Tax=Pontibacillus chungwhensis TaxID=265426 RepID=A0ABY8UUA6_9BACI|nr:MULTISPECIES: competence type IV pilus assembly protein ComGB [Pontibacillus]MCD5323551.1 type II secretion system F family protein [Pontibacillus sp. HN14]WIF96920.1 competence type IV pilus assembly protein ComGB [Pontibacillus chungwhensis]
MLSDLLPNTRRWVSGVRPSSIKMKIQIRLLQRLSHLLSRGYSLQHSLEILSFDSSLHPPIKRLKHHLLEGVSLEDALEELGFSKYVVSFLHVAKMDNKIEDALIKGSNLLLKQQTYQKKFVTLIRYPLVLFFLFIGLMVFTKQFLLPTFLQLYASMNYESAKITQLIKGLNLFTSLLIWLFPITAGAAGIWMWAKHKLRPTQLSRLYERLPLIRDIITLQTTFLFTYHFGCLLQSGVSVRKSLSLLSTSPHFPILHLETNTLYQELENGSSLSSSIRTCSFLKEDLATLIHQSQNEGKLSDDLIVYSEWIIEEIEQKASKFLSFIQPVMFLLLGISILFIYSSIMMPIFEWMKTM